MDYRESSNISGSNDFWFKAKLDLINILLSKIGKGKRRILSIGTGTGEEIKVLKRYGKIYVIDIESRAIEMIPKGLCEEKKVCDATKIKYPDNFFDVVTSFDVFEHIKNDKKSIDEVKRVLKLDGYLIFTVPAFQSIYSSHDKALGHERRYDKSSLRLMLDNFRVLQLGYWNFFLFIPIVIMRLIKMGDNPKLDHMKIGYIVNTVLYNIMKLENFLIRRNMPLPIGLTLYGICKKVR